MAEQNRADDVIVIERRQVVAEIVREGLGGETPWRACLAACADALADTAREAYDDRLILTYEDHTVTVEMRHADMPAETESQTYADR